MYYDTFEGGEDAYLDAAYEDRYTINDYLDDILDFDDDFWDDEDIPDVTIDGQPLTLTMADTLAERDNDDA